MAQRKKKSAAKRPNNTTIDQALRELSRVGSELQSALKEAQKKFKQADLKTKQQVVAGVAGAAAILAAAIGVKKIVKSKKRK